MTTSPTTSSTTTTTTLTTTTTSLGDTAGLGAMDFGTTVDERTSFDLLDRYVDAGGVWIDTADCYSFWHDPSGFGGQSELLLGRWLAARPGVRDRVKIATKVGCECLTPRSWPGASEGLAGEVVRRVAQQSLTRMGIDHIDLFWAHRDDHEVDQVETVAAFGELVSDGTVGRWGQSNTALWRTVRAEAVADRLDVARPADLQLRYTYLQPRPMVRDQDHRHRFGWVTDETLDWADRTDGATVWAYGSFLSGSYDRTDRPISEAFRHEGNDRRLAALTSVATELGVTRTEVVLAWLTGGQPAIVPLVSASRPEQLATNLAGVRLVLPDALRARLDEPW